MSRKRLMWLGMTVLVLGMLLAACGGGEPAAQEEEEAPAPAAEEEEASEPEAEEEMMAGQYDPIVMLIWSGPEYDNMVQVAQAYQEETGNEVIVEEVAREALRDKVATSLIAGISDYDAMYISGDWVPEFVAAETLTQFNQFIDNPDVADVSVDNLQPGVDYLSIDGNIYGFPSEGDTAWFWYREDLLEEAGIEVPQTWPEFLAAAETLNNPPETYGAVIGASRDEAGWDFMHYFFAFGGQIVDESTWEVTFNNETGVEALSFYKGLVDSGVVSPDVTTFGYNEIQTALSTGQAAMGIEWMAATQFLTSCDTSPDVCDSIRYTLLPGYEDASGNLVRGMGGSQWGYVIPEGSENQEAAYKFIEWLTGPTGAKLWALNGGIPSNVVALGDPDVVAEIPQFELLAEAMPYRNLIPNTTVSFDLTEAFHEAAHNVAAGIDPQEAADEAAAKMEAALESGGYR